MAGTPSEGQRRPYILDIKGNSLDDGPGIRSVVFFKGCPLACLWCHNPESKRPGLEISFDSKECIACDACLSSCPRGALSRANPGFVDRARCDLCFACATVCPSGALSRVGREMSIAEIAAKVIVDKPFFETSGGGVTLSGGEPTLCMDFTGELLSLLKTHGIHTLIETCGLFEWKSFMDRLYPHLDAVYYDIKLMDAAAHARYCGVSNTRILDNFARLHDAAQADGKTLLPRIPLIPDITDTVENITTIADFLHGLGVKRGALLAYNPLWHEKSDKIGADDPWRGNRQMSSWPERERLARCREILAQQGIEM